MEPTPKPSPQQTPTPELVAEARRWLAQDPDPHTRAELATWLLRRDGPRLRAAFGGRLRFGTAGLRAPMGPGPSALNNLVVRQSCAGIAAVLRAQVQDATTRGVAVGYDGRRNSRAFAEAACGVLLAQGFAVHFVEEPTPTPVVGFYVKLHKLAAGLVITASHNPPMYNGLKVYWHDGAQIVAPQDADIAAAIDVVAADARPVPCVEGASLGTAAQLSFVAAAAQQSYLSALRCHLGVTPPPKDAPVLSVAYTPLHGVGAALVRRAVTPAGLCELHVVAEQESPDGAFPTVAFPNPEESGSMDRVVALATARGCALACANDPDADRLAVAARDEHGALCALSGDELGILLADHMLQAPRPGDVVATTRASSRMLAQLARAKGVRYEETLTGFKWLARAGLAAAAKGERLVFAYEEALGYAVTDLVWDKDGVSALVACLQLAGTLARQNETLWHALARLQVAHGIYVSAQQTLPLDPANGAALMARLRAALPQQLGERQLVAQDDLLLHAGAGRSDVLVLFYAEPGANEAQARARGLRVILRPSGTEPKLKAYYELVGTADDVASWRRARGALRAQIAAVMHAHAGQLATFAR